VEQTLIILKPDCVQRRLMGRIIQRFEDKGLTVTAMKMMRISRDLAERHYAPHKGKPFYPGLIEYITSGPVVVMVVAGPRAIGTIRGDFGASTTYNLVHGSDAPESAATEIALYFTPAEILNYTTPESAWVSKNDER